MYGEAFDDDWTSLDREEAMFRAYALGVDAALGNDHPERVNRLAREASRALVQLAYDEGKSVAEDELRSGDGEAEAADRDGASAREIWEELVEERRNDPKAQQLVRVSESRNDVPAALSRPEFLDLHSRDADALRLPRFLLE
ncbi:hypothetical protein [Halanaeroarchaeum sulfurireducens]|uniref:Uncharacterized protein n=1 Tax=Halanaeroarchaeum sulfurireducens TaxID=1604004 RepID=A0A0F7PBF0_9EURY|nr:hypothetical protein [Halanaeroarchaeum sulfurireducens]AKH96643.1 hypothetical protein HLASF_0129 [Halanaeroarchaeum sulfurireducens]ALG81045.1 hypothetical protein HLASA_0129 [Halanaeroarchaeum sulfurireducens]